MAPEHGASSNAEASGQGDALVVVIGAGPAGLTAALELVRRGRAVTVLEASDQIGGISRTEVRDGWRFDIGGHRFFTKVPEVEKFWHEVLPDEDFLQRPRMSRISYQGKLYDYPLKAGNALKNLGIIEAVRCVLSYVWVRIHPPKDQTNFEGWVAARFGWRLYRIFFKTYTEKLWGIPGDQIQADWAAQRIKNLSLFSAIKNAIFQPKGQTEITTLIDAFQYPKYGPGMMWEKCRDLVVEGGGQVIMKSPVVALHRDGDRVTAVTVLQSGPDGVEQEKLIACSDVISSMPLQHLVQAMDPKAPHEVIEAAQGLGYRDFLTVALVVPEEDGFPDNWIYIHTPGVKVGRIQNYGSWSPYLVKDGLTCLGLEYFVNEGDGTWTSTDEDLVALAKKELAQLGLVKTERMQAGYVVRVPKAYPIYDEGYDKKVDTIRHWIADETVNVQATGRNGMHRYNNQDHSMVTAMYAVDNICGIARDLWTVNVEEEYHEEKRSGPNETGGAATAGTGRSAPILPRKSS
ncbi:NAD(P)/FAD-dependent oxidoreductase [Sporichthya sp.]|uniref:NAD(P)/FAD-dependent oxidoreductase n=1 Tax=Sporichthya sp. TaxID=65475 RepID=UPI001855353A|nr:NAD(P)/FAD-dependent oxidoreductase [Sporichthya sp.]MBA3742730.1 NAD(P)/FAD-dependent oxidoreductase [Sporichthya sp.]